MVDVIELELDKLKNDLNNNKMNKDVSNNYFDEDDYNDCFSLNEINKNQTIFMKKVVELLTEQYLGQYVVFSNWCVHIVTVDFYYKRKLKHGIFC